MTDEVKKPTAGQLHYGHQGIDRLYARVWGDSIQFGFYTAPDIDLEAAVTETKRRMLEVAALPQPAHVLEVASGWGATARYLARHAGHRVVATNIEDDHLKTGATLSEISALSSLIDHRYADFHDLPFPDSQFDCWWAQEATVHATDKSQLFSEALRVLKPRGRIVLSDQTTDVARCRPDDLSRITARHGSQDLFGVNDFVAALEDAGFTDIEYRDWSTHMTRHFASLVRRIERTHDRLVEDIPEDVVAFNLAMWRFGRDLSARGGMGWFCFSATKPG